MWDLRRPGSNLCLLRWQADSLPLSHQGSPGIILDSKHPSFKISFRGLPWWSSGYNSVLPMLGARFWSPVRELDPACYNYVIRSKTKDWIDTWWLLALGSFQPSGQLSPWHAVSGMFLEAYHVIAMTAAGGEQALSFDAWHHSSLTWWRPHLDEDKRKPKAIRTTEETTMHDVTWWGYTASGGEIVMET